MVPGADVYPKAKAAALKAQEFDRNSAEAHASLALVLQEYDRDWLAAEREYRRAIQLNPSYATARHWYALSLALTGRDQEAIREIEQARRLDPLSIRTNANVVLVLYLGHSIATAFVRLDDRDQAFAWLQKGLDVYDGDMDNLKVDAALDPLRSDPRFQDLLRRMNFPP